MRAYHHLGGGWQGAELVFLTPATRFRPPAQGLLSQVEWNSELGQGTRLLETKRSSEVPTQGNRAHAASTQGTGQHTCGITKGLNTCLPNEETNEQPDHGGRTWTSLGGFGG